ncbi:GNAT family N-acetyltransferase [Rhizobium sp. S152]|uniref:GNAT family N-acetyltransferase n=1 Tax=Rhizobium sp. S152 TaxID=3055038 RepID=UPI0025AA1870|nr:GNAT family N-acetyltransferase [Rhizobium sp. S152]MDM9629115.1 GNAT family N-acetyltransferase [Rhizobium sp. S152]
MGDAWAIRQARIDELPRLTEIELDAFATLAEAIGGDREPHALPRSILQQSLDAGLLLVAADMADHPVGFLAAEEIDETLYVKELNVSTAWQRRGVGRGLMMSAFELAKSHGLSAVTLTTDRHVLFNAPFYASLGFVLTPTEALPRFLREKLDHEISVGMDPDRRVAMVLAL